MSEERIRKLLLEHATGKYSHLIIYSDHWDYTYSIKLVKYGEDVSSAIAKIKSMGSVGMYTIDEVYNYNLDLEVQLKEQRAYHIEPISKTETKNKEQISLDTEIKISDNLKKAIYYAAEAHKDELRKNGVPYIKHPLEVLKYVMKYKKSKNLEELLMAACLHDTIENTEVTYYDLVANFGYLVANLVLELTTDEEMKNALGKDIYLSFKMKNMTSWALVLKLCDRLSNLNDLNGVSEEFKNKYVDETIVITSYLLDNAKLTNTHLNIIEEINKVLFRLCINDTDKLKKVSELMDKLNVLKGQDLNEDYNIYNDLDKISDDTLKRILV